MVTCEEDEWRGGSCLSPSFSHSLSILGEYSQRRKVCTRERRRNIESKSNEREAGQNRAEYERGGKEDRENGRG